MHTRIPHLGSAAIFFALILASLVLVEAALAGFAALHGAGHANGQLAAQLGDALSSPRLQLAAQTAAYLLALGAAWFLFPLLWRGTSLLRGIRWNRSGAHWWLVPVGFAIGFLAQWGETHLSLPSNLPMDQLFRKATVLPVLILLAVFIGPLTEEVFFRGFLLPALANGLDFLRLPHGSFPGDPQMTLAAHERWVMAPQESTPALVVSSILTSALFALLHAAQLGFTWSAVALLGAVSLVLCLVRIRFRSVAASTLVHVSYNSSIFVSLAVASGGFRHLDRL